MKHTILITSFTTWMPHHRSNAADDLVERFHEKREDAFHYLRKIPVDFALAPLHVLERFDLLLPRVLICCGMAEERTRLNVESRAVLNDHTLQTTIDLHRLTADLPMTEISHDAGRFVCNTLYYRALEHLQRQESEHHCLFVHVPVVTEDNAAALAEDFSEIVKRLSEL